MKSGGVMPQKMYKTAEQLNIKESFIEILTHSTTSRLGLRTHFSPPIASKVIHIQSLRDYFKPLPPYSTFTIY